MTRKIISDIIVSRKSIRQIPIPIKKKLKVELENFGKDYDDKTESLNVIRTGQGPNWRRKPINPKFVIWLIAIICLLALFFGVSIIFSSATVVITPRTEKIIFANDTYTAKSDSLGVADLSVEILKVEQTLSETIDATQDKDVSQKATGKIVIYNNYSTAPQRLINNTRFEANNGKIYRLSNSVVVPGQKKSEGQIIPGSIEVTVFADQAGENYNLKLADLTGDFKIPGFKGDPRYQSFYARQKTDIIGGFVGKKRVVADSLRKETEDIIKTKLQEQLLKELYAVKPENYLVFKDGYSINYELLDDIAVDSSKVKLSLKGSLSGYAFNSSKLAKYLATDKIIGFDGLLTEFVPLENLVATFTVKNNIFDLKLNGEANIKWLYDSEGIKKDLAGKSSSEVKVVLQKYRDSILGMKVIFKPVWTRYFPDNLNKIRIIEEV